ncbi:hypothetical protein ACIPM5_03120 [Streptomyces microflavus]|uniref:Mce-associated membrane protein n=1 Tax=Streptomyces microflavus TaxID=1919 RepID=A0A6N9VH68_STRMI|nr:MULTISPECIES: hypothetical protein [Streptomyces]MBK3587395.1 hypothetical protein [Streptomyces sp. MBT57]MEE1734088.1 hypothetical protein [Streptomyces sp. BE282]MEE1734761.1 hypothetical protein [Streptomyces sp. BE282]NEB72220.1 hypothetical protein [Streptomyces microflavus]OXY84857.1 hypothetical protein BEH93_02485 [Streptomyces sp. 2R]
MSERTALESKPVEDEGRADDTEPDSTESPEDPESIDGTEEPGRHPRWPRILGALLTVALLATGGALFVEGQQLRDTPATANLALTDAGATTRVTGDVSNALGRIFSYGPDATALTKDAAREVLAGKALQQYAALFGQVEKQAADQKLTLTTHVVRAGVTRLTGSSAHLLVFLDQVYERRGRPATTASAQLSVTAELRDGQWRIVEIGSI